jgi:hypothetical protein
MGALIMAGRPPNCSFTRLNSSFLPDPPCQFRLASASPATFIRIFLVLSGRLIKRSIIYFAAKHIFKCALGFFTNPLTGS